MAETHRDAHRPRIEGSFTNADLGRVGRRDHHLDEQLTGARFGAVDVDDDGGTVPTA